MLKQALVEWLNEHKELLLHLACLTGCQYLYHDTTPRLTHNFSVHLCRPGVPGQQTSNKIVLCCAKCLKHLQTRELEWDRRWGAGTSPVTTTGAPQYVGLSARPHRQHKMPAPECTAFPFMILQSTALSPQITKSKCGFPAEEFRFVQLL